MISLVFLNEEKEENIVFREAPVMAGAAVKAHSPRRQKKTQKSEVGAISQLQL